MSDATQLGRPARTEHIPVASRHAATSRLTRAVIRRQRRVWTRRAPSWASGGAADLAPVVAAVLDQVPGGPGRRVLDVGCGTGTLALPLAESGAEVLAVDVSAVMTDAVAVEATRRGLVNLSTLTTSAESLDLPPSSLDAVVSNYALHHLRDADKSRLLDSASRWLRPGGVLVIGDLMLGRGASSRDRRIIRAKVAALARKGPGGWWRVAKNSFRFLLRLQERPLPMASWVRLLRETGFVDVRSIDVVAEAGVVVGTAANESVLAPVGSDRH